MICVLLFFFFDKCYFSCRCWCCCWCCFCYCCCCCCCCCLRRFGQGNFLKKTIVNFFQEVSDQFSVLEVVGWVTTTPPAGLTISRWKSLLLGINWRKGGRSPSQIVVSSFNLNKICLHLIPYYMKWVTTSWTYSTIIDKLYMFYSMN